MKYYKILVFGLLILTLGFVVFTYINQKPIIINEDVATPLIGENNNDIEIPPNETEPNLTLSDGHYCYTYSQEATPDAPYKVSESLDITIKDGKVTGTKSGNQAGPDMTNGYTGKITGTVNDNKIDVVFTYTIEGSDGKEGEIYQTSKTGLEKLRYPLIEKDGILVPDTSKDFNLMSYSMVPCEPSN